MTDLPLLEVVQFMSLYGAFYLITVTNIIVVFWDFLADQYEVVSNREVEENRHMVFQLKNPAILKIVHRYPTGQTHHNIMMLLPPC